MPADFFARLLREGRSVLLLLDGLDEVADEAERAEVSQAVKELATGRGERLTIVVAVRSAAWHGATMQAGFQEIKVQPLTPEHIQKLVRHAYRCIYPNEAEQRSQSDELVTGIERLEAERQARLGEDAPRLIDSPLLVRMLIVVHLNKRTLPEHRAELYIQTTETLIAQDHDPDLEQATAIAKRVGGSRENHRELVQFLAHGLHQRGERQGREIEERDLRAVLGEQTRFQPWVQEFIDLTCERGTLLEERDRVYRFIHLAFQEFLAARYLAEIVRDADGIVRFFAQENRLLESWWREPALLTVGYLGFTSPTVAEQLIRRMAGLNAGAQGEPALTPDLRLAMLETAGAAYLELPSRDEALQKALARRIATCFADATLMNASQPRLRAAAGDALARLGDPRPGVGLRGDGLPDIAWCKVPATDPQGRSKFFYQEGKHPGLPDFWIAHYPITYAQFQTFVDAPDGYRNSRWWQGLDEDRSKQGETRWQQRWPIANRPRENVTWGEAVAFCRWLTTQAAAHPDLLPARLGDGWSIRLPTEWEWEKAARGWDDRLYPWGGQEYKAGYANVDETDQKNGPNYLHQTSAVGIYPQSASPFGVEEMSGNVWEFCLNDYHNPANIQETGSKRRAVRGGAWYLNPSYSSVSARLGDFDLGLDGGFRVVFAASPYLRPLSL